jgi:hypothetical protein
VEVSFSKNITSQIEDAPFLGSIEDAPYFWSIEDAPFFLSINSGRNSLTMSNRASGD